MSHLPSSKSIISWDKYHDQFYVDEEQMMNPLPPSNDVTKKRKRQAEETDDSSSVTCEGTSNSSDVTSLDRLSVANVQQTGLIEQSSSLSSQNRTQQEVPPSSNTVPVKSVPITIGLDINSPSVPKQPLQRSSLFQKASGGTVHISERARLRAAQILASATTDAPLNTSSVADSNSRSFDTPAKLPSNIISNPISADRATASAPFSSSAGLRTSSLLQKASGKSVQISDAARQRANQWLSADSTEQIENQQTSLATPQAQAKQMQQPVITPAAQKSSLLIKASGKAVFISDEARAKGARLLQQNTNDEVPTNSNTNAVTPTGTAETPRFSSLLQKANGNAVVVSEEARQRAKSMLLTDYSTSSVRTSSDVNIVDQSAASRQNIVTPAHSLCQSQSFNHIPTTGQKDPATSSIAAIVAVEKGNPPTNNSNRSMNSNRTPPLPEITTAAEETRPQLPPVDRRTHFPTPDLSRSALLEEPIPLQIVTEVQLSNQLKKRLQILSKISSSNLLSTLKQLLVHPDDIIQRVKADYSDCMALFIDFQLLWIAWTLVSYERRHPELYLNQLVTDETLEDVLRARCDRYLAFDRQLKQQSSRKMINKTHLSPLQRASEIMLLEQPLCLCIMLSVSIRGAESLSSSKCLFENSVMVSDGWFQLEAKFDTSAMELLRSNKIRDGTKICVFSAQLIADGNNDSKVFIAISLNGIRRAHPQARLGVIPSSSLNRGLSIRTLVMNGGSVYAIQGTIIRIVTRYQITAPQSDKGNNKSKKPLFMSELEAQELIEAIEAQLRQQATEHELRLQIATDEDEKAQEEDELNDLMHAAQRISVQKHVDVLIRCSISGILAWIRLSASSEGEESEVDLTKAIGRAILMSNLVISKRSQSKLMQLIATRSSAWRLLPTHDTRTEVSVGLVSSDQDVIIEDGIQQNLKINYRNKALIGSELTKKLFLIDVSSQHEDTKTKKESLATDQIQIQLFAIDDNYLCYRLSLDCYSASSHRYTKMVVGSSFIVEFACIGSYDSFLDVLQLHQNDRTAIKSSSQSGGKKIAEFVEQQVMVMECQEERNRLKAIQSLQASFASTVLPFMQFDYRRLRMDNVSLLITTDFILCKDDIVSIIPIKLTMLVEEHSLLPRELQQSLPWLFNEETYCMELGTAAVLHFGSDALQLDDGTRSILLQRITSFDSDGDMNGFHIYQEGHELHANECEGKTVKGLMESLSFIILPICNH